MDSEKVKKEVSILGKLALPIIISQLAQVANGFTDTVMAGRLGALDLGAIAVGVNLWILPFLFALGLMMALSSMTSHYFGAGKLGAIKDLLGQTLWLSLVLALIAFFSTRLLVDGLALLELDANVSRVAGDYVRAVSWGLPAMVGYLALRFLSEGIGYAKPMMVIQLLGLGLNAFFNWLFMFGKWGFPAMGAEGAGWATALVMWINLGLLILYIRTHRRYDQIWATATEPRDWSRLMELLHLGLPIAFTLLAEVGMFVAVALLMGKIGVVEVAAHQIAMNFGSLAFMIPLGISAATTVRVGHALGEGDPVEARFRGYTGIGMAAFCMLFTAAIMLLFPSVIAAIYTDDVAVQQVAISLLFMAATFELSDGVQVAANGALRGMKDTIHPLWLTLAAYWLVSVPLSWYFGLERKFGPQGLWFGLVVGLTIMAILLVWRFNRLTKRKIRKTQMAG